MFRVSPTFTLDLLLLSCIQCASTHRSVPVVQRRLYLATRSFYHVLRSKIRSKNTPASDFLRKCSPGSLREVKLSAKHGGPDLLDLRGVSTSRMPAATNITVTKVTKSSGSNDPNFHQQLIDNSVNPYGSRYLDGRALPKPEIWNEIQQMLAEPRASLSPFPEDEYEKFANADAEVTSEHKATSDVIPIIQGTIRDMRCVDGPGIPTR